MLLPWRLVWRLLLRVAPRSAWCSMTGVALRRSIATFSVDRNKAFYCDAGVAHGTLKLLARLLEPVVDARPAVEVAATCEDRLLGYVEADAAVEAGIAIH